MEEKMTDYKRKMIELAGWKEDFVDKLQVFSAIHVDTSEYMDISCQVITL